MKNNNNISIVVASDNFYAILVAALLKSIDVNHKTGEHIDFYIVDDGIAEKFRKKLETSVDPARITIKWIRSNTVLPPDVTIPIDKSAFPLITYLRVFSPLVFGDDVQKMIHLDADTIVQDDISKLWNVDLGDHILGAVQDLGQTVACEWGGIPNYRELGLAADAKYFNAGVLLVNVKKWKEEGISFKIMKALSDYKEHVVLADQYGLNVVMANKWLELDPKWNWFAAKKDEGASLIHFLDIKPIFKSYRSEEVYKDAFFKYLNMTPWKGFKPISDNRRIFRKIQIKIKKALMRLFK